MSVVMTRESRKTFGAAEVLDKVLTQGARLRWNRPEGLDCRTGSSNHLGEAPCRIGAPELVLDSDDRPYVIRRARTQDELDAVYRITHDSIVSAGYMAPLRGGRMRSYPEIDASPLTTVMIAVRREDEAVIGTVSLTGDGPLGLPTDSYFPAETDRIRDENRRLVSPFRIAADPSLTDRSSINLVLDLLRWSVLVARQRYDFETALGTFNPKHESLYQRLMGARTVAKRDNLDHGSLAAGGVMLRIDREKIPGRFMLEVDSLADHLGCASGTAR